MTFYVIVAGVALVLVLLALAGTVVDRVKGKRFRAGWLCMVVGLRGGGKSLFVASVIARRLADGDPVIANFSVPGCQRMLSWEDVIRAPEGTTVVLDEAHQWARATAGKSPDPMADWYISHTRKLGHEVWVIAQHESQIAGFVKHQTNEYVECAEWIGKRHRATAWAPHEFRRAKARPLWSWWYSPRGAATRVYDTLELVAPVESDRDTAEQRREKAALRRLIDEINERRASPAGLGASTTMEEPAAHFVSHEGDRLLDSDADVSTLSRS